MALTAPSKTVAALDKGRLAAGISASATTITITPIFKTVSGVRTKQGFDSTAGECIISQGGYQERISFEGLSVDATTKVTSLTSCTRGLPFTNTTANFTGGTGRIWPKGAAIAVVDAASYNQSGVFTNVANTFTEDQTIESGNKLKIGGANAYVWTENTGTDLKFKDANNSEKTLSQLAAAGGSDEKTKVTSNDTTGDYLFNKLAAGAGITLTETNDAGDEDVTIAAANTVATGHTGLSTVTTGGLLVGAGTSNMTIIGPGTEGQVPTSNGTTIAMATPIPIGGMMIWTTDTAPTRWLLCYGQAVNRTTYATLFAVVSTTFGVGDGSTTFNLPDMRGRFPLGQDDMGGSSANRVTATEADTIGSAAGVADGTHLHVVDPSNTAVNRGGGGGNSYAFDADTGGNSDSTSVMPPYQTFNYIIYAGV